MCGRFVSTSSPQHLADVFGAVIETDPLATSFNVAPTNDVYAVSADADGSRSLRTYRWGLVPSWAKDARIGSKMINARAETLAEKPAFKSLFRSRRVLVPMDGFYEWKAVPGSKSKQPVYLHPPTGGLLAAAGLWSAWRDPQEGPEAPWLHTLTVVTTAANELVAPIHDRMPVFLSPGDWNEWLDPTNRDLESLTRLLRPAPEALLAVDLVSTAVNNVRNKGPELIEPIEA